MCTYATATLHCQCQKSQSNGPNSAALILEQYFFFKLNFQSTNILTLNLIISIFRMNTRFCMLWPQFNWISSQFCESHELKKSPSNFKSEVYCRDVGDVHIRRSNSKISKAHIVSPDERNEDNMSDKKEGIEQPRSQTEWKEETKKYEKEMSIWTMYHTLDIYCNNLFLKCTFLRSMCNIYMFYHFLAIAVVIVVVGCCCRYYCQYFYWCFCSWSLGCCKQSNWNIFAFAFYFPHLMGAPTHICSHTTKHIYHYYHNRTIKLRILYTCMVYMYDIYTIHSRTQ